MAWAYVIRASDREAFKRCRRAWDFGSRSRQNLEPSQPVEAFDFDKAMRDALALYYFPGMWQWDRRSVMPTVLASFFQSMEQQRANCLKIRDLSVDEENDWTEHVDLGARMLEHYFAWGPTVDDFDPLKIASDVDVNIPDPHHAGHDLAKPKTSPALPVRYRDRTDVLILDGLDAYWVMDHRISETWLDLDCLLLDERSVAACWAWQNFNLGMKIQGVIYNELLKAAPDESQLADPSSSSVLTPLAKPRGPPPREQYQGLYKQAIREPERRIAQCGNAYFRRTAVARSQTEIEMAGRQLGLEALDMIHPELEAYSNPTWSACARCAFRRPCVTMNEGADAGALIETSYRKRDDDEFAPGRLGASTWSFDRGSSRGLRR